MADIKTVVTTYGEYIGAIEEGADVIRLKNPRMVIQSQEGFGFAKGVCVTSVESPEEIILKKNGLRLRLQLDNEHPIGKIDSFHLKDIVIESALSVIMDCEDSIVSVDTNDKIETFKNYKALYPQSLNCLANLQKKIKDGLHHLNQE